VARDKNASKQWANLSRRTVKRRNFLLSKQRFVLQLLLGFGIIAEEEVILLSFILPFYKLLTNPKYGLLTKLLGRNYAAKKFHVRRLETE